MHFNSIEYLIFLPIVFVLYWAIKPLKIQNLFVVIVSYIFYGWWDWHFLLLIAFTTLCSYISGLGIARYMSEGCIGGGKNLCIGNIFINLLILGVYKYYNFFVDSFISAFSLCGINILPATLNLILPVGISFYTFQALSYTIDVYRGKLNATRDIVSFFAFISFFPQLVAGPIERATNLLPQFQKSRIFDYESAVDGTKQILWGLFKKMVIADNCADLVNYVWSNYSEHNSYMLIITAIFFTFQIYGDFSGYSDIAIGTARLFGIKLMRNFNFPYFSRNIAEFWKRWHISLNTWFVDYIYIPLGGSREGNWKKFRNTMVIFLLSGLWHGANWTFVMWGLYHALLFLPLMLIGNTKKYTKTVNHVTLFVPPHEFMSMISTFVLVVIGWIIFRANSAFEFFDYMRCLTVNFNIPESEALPLKTIFFIFVLMVVEWLNRDKQYGLQFQLPTRFLQWSMYVILTLLILTQSGQQAQFIYFQF